MTRSAFQRSTLPRIGYTYERAMSVPGIAICLQHMERHTQHMHRQMSDTMYCSCGKCWDMNDPYPPEGCEK